MDFIKKTKIVATLGPSCSESKIIEKMILEGVNVFRINFSHADYKLVKEKIEIIRALDKKLNTSSSILGDLQGPKIRLGKIEEDSEISEGEEYDFYTDKEFIGKFSLQGLLAAPQHEPLKGHLISQPVVLNHDASIAQAMEVASHFVGESIPVIHHENGRIIGVVSEADIFGAYLATQSRVRDLEHN